VKKLFMLLSLISMTFSSFAQWSWNIDFEEPGPVERIFIDTVSLAHNVWQVGVPGKTIFNSALSPVHAIVTDTLNPYPVNDTSQFIITHVRPGPWGGGNYSLLLDFSFKMNTDTLTDFGRIEVSIDHGANWINLLTQDATYGFNWVYPKPVLSGSTNGWVHFSEDINNLTYGVGYSDTLWYRFTFISDNIQTNKEGWMIDDLLFNDYWEGISEIHPGSLLSVSPNPASDFISITTKIHSPRPKVQILNLQGK